MDMQRALHERPESPFRLDWRAASHWRIGGNRSACLWSLRSLFLCILLEHRADTDIQNALTNVRFGGKSGHPQIDRAMSTSDPEPTCKIVFCCDAQQVSFDVVRYRPRARDTLIKRREFITPLGAAMMKKRPPDRAASRAREELFAVTVLALQHRLAKSYRLARQLHPTHLSLQLFYHLPSEDSRPAMR